ncbi:MAG: sulfatase [Acidobacteria bacterium]|nr:MAG: sulfatase [Acidobacteriota bacterium]
MNPVNEYKWLLTRRHFFGLTSTGLGAAVLASLLNEDLLAQDEVNPSGTSDQRTEAGGLPGLPHFAPKAKRVIYLFQSGAPSQMDLFDYKPKLNDFQGTELPDSVRKGQRLTGMTATQASFPIARSIFKFAQHGKSGAWVSDLMPHTAQIVDELCLIKSMYTEAINHDPAITFFQTGAQLAGRPSIGAWLSYGLGSENKDLPAFVAMVSQGTGNPNDQPLYDRLWGSGFLPTKYQGVKFRSVGDPVLFLSNPEGISAGTRRRFLDDLAKLNQLKLEEFGDPEIATRIAQYEMAYRMQTSVPELTDLSREPEHVFTLYGPDAKKPGTFANNCLLARRLAERGVRFIQLFHRGWDQHTTLPKQITGQCRDTDQPSAALISDLKQRGLLDDTLVIWGGEFGRTVYCQGKLTADDYGRDHHPRCFTLWMAGGGIKSGITHGETDDYCYNIIRDPVHVHDLHATILHCLGVDHTRLTFKFQGRHHRLTDVHGEVVKKILA